MKLIENKDAGKRKVETKPVSIPMPGWTQVFGAGGPIPEGTTSRAGEHRPAPFAMATDDNHSILFSLCDRDAPSGPDRELTKEELLDPNRDEGEFELAYFKRQANGKIFCRVVTSNVRSAYLSLGLTRGSEYSFGELHRIWEKAVVKFKQKHRLE